MRPSLGISLSAVGLCKFEMIDSESTPILNAHSCSTLLESANSCVALMSYAPTALLAPQTSSGNTFACPALTALLNARLAISPRTQIDASAIDPRALRAWQAPHTAVTAPRAMSMMNTGTLSKLRTSLKKSFTARTRPPMLRRLEEVSISNLFNSGKPGSLVFGGIADVRVGSARVASAAPRTPTPRDTRQESESACHTLLFATW
jgi:hypothetical protein